MAMVTYLKCDRCGYATDVEEQKNQFVSITWRKYQKATSAGFAEVDLCVTCFQKVRAVIKGDK